ncbi:MAG: flagellar hook-basal body complex protein [Mariprofundaceae bacterium]
MINMNASVGAMRKIAISHEVTANNLANIESSGFKEKRTDMGTDSVSITSNERHAAVVFRGNKLDLAIEGDGLLAVSTPQGNAFTRSGALTLSRDGLLSDADGNPLVPQVQVPSQATSISMRGNGMVFAMIDGAEEQIGQVSIATFVNPSSLASIGSNLLQESVGSGSPVMNQPGQGGAGVLVVGGLEASNVDVGENFVQLIIDQHSFAYNVKAVSIQEEMQRSLLSIKA